MHSNFDRVIDGISAVGQVVLQVAHQLGAKSVEFTKQQMQKSMECCKEYNDNPSIVPEKQVDFVNSVMADYHKYFREILEIGVKCSASMVDVYVNKIVPAAAEYSKSSAESATQK